MRHVRRSRTAPSGAVAILAIALLAASLALTEHNAKAANQGVTIDNFAFSPATVTVNVGDTVTWTNAEGGGIPHTATSDTGAFDTGSIPDGASSTAITFSTAGTFSYHCTIHPTMLGTVVVQQATTPTTTATTTATTTTTATATAATSTPTSTATSVPTSTPTTVPPTSTATSPAATSTATAAPAPPATGGGTVGGTGAGGLLVLAGLGAIALTGGTLIAIRRRV